MLTPPLRNQKMCGLSLLNSLIFHIDKLQALNWKGGNFGINFTTNDGGLRIFYFKNQSFNWPKFQVLIESYSAIHFSEFDSEHRTLSSEPNWGSIGLGGERWYLFKFQNFPNFQFFSENSLTLFWFPGPGEIPWQCTVFQTCRHSVKRDCQQWIKT